MQARGAGRGTALMATPPSRSSPAGQPAEPSPALRAVADLSLRYPLAPVWVSAVAQLNDRLRSQPADGWVPVYREAIQIVEGVVEDLGRDLDRMQRSLLAADDPAEIRNRLASGPRRESDRLLEEARSALGRQQGEWAERLKRQEPELRKRCQELARDLRPVETRTGEGLSLHLDPGRWAQLQGFVARTADAWVEDVQGKVEADLSAAVAPLVRSPLARGSAVSPPEPSPPRREVRLELDLPPLTVEVPGMAAALWNAFRSRYMAVGMLFMLVPTLGSAIGVATGVAAGASAGSNLLRASVILLALPPLCVAAVLGAAADRRKARAKGVAAWQEQTSKVMRSAMGSALEDQRKALERWLGKRVHAWEEACQRWSEQVVAPRVAEAEQAAAEAVREAKLAQARATEEQTTLKAARNQLQQNLLFDLRRRLRELEAAPAPGE